MKQLMTTLIVMAFAALGVCGQEADSLRAQVLESITEVTLPEALEAPEVLEAVEESVTPQVRPPRVHAVVSAADLRSAVFDGYDMWADTLSWRAPEASSALLADSAFNWINDATFNDMLLRKVRQSYMVAHPEEVKYNESLLPEPPRKFRGAVDPKSARLVFYEVKADTKAPVSLNTEVERRHWIHTFDAGLQVSQAYVSPNWYQGGSNNMTAMLNLGYSVKLNPNFHPNLLAEASFNYKLSVNATPEDSLRNYNISEDLFQFIGKFGVRAARKWFYSLTSSFKTQFLNNYEVNNPRLKAAFLSPAELNMGIGMTYNTVNRGGRLTFDASISPLSWNMKTCINHRMNPTAYGIKEGHEVVHEIGSSGEAKLAWKICSNISLASRLFVFTDYTYLQGDWENTLSFDINRFLSTRLYVHLRYDSSTPRVADSHWHTWQLKEILSFGFSYKFTSI